MVIDSGLATGSFAVSGSYNQTGDAFISGSLTITNTLTAQTIVAQTITSSTDFVTGSTRFGTLLSNTHQFTGSVLITGSLALSVEQGTTENKIVVTDNSGNFK
jgi:hypothetical protein